MKSVCVFCGSASGSKIEYTEAAKMLGKILASNNLDLVYGGGNIGLMGVVADAVLHENGKVIGVITEKLKNIELAHPCVSEMIVVESMDERKKKMTELSDAFITMPGGFGTLDELFEVLSLNQLGIIQKPVAILNTKGFYDALLKHLDLCFEEKFLRDVHRNSIIVDEDPEKLIEKLMSHQPASLGKWLDEFKK
ncbi:MAG: TIGR00730 family Rossman fold protein [Bacteroidota bacterium]